MGRQPDGVETRSMTMVVRMTPGGLGQVDRLRGEMARSSFVRRAIAFAVRHLEEFRSEEMGEND